MADSPPSFSVEMTRTSNGWLIDVSVQGVSYDRIGVDYRKYGAHITVVDEDASGE